MTFNPDIHHRRSIRLREYDYSSVGAYFVTICAQGRECLFGNVADGEMRLNDAGRMVGEWLFKLPDKFPGVVLDEYIVMPNHFHGIICIVGAPPRGCPSLVVSPPPSVVSPPPFVTMPAINVKNGQPRGDCPYGKNEIKSKSGQPHGAAPTLGDVMDWFKTMTTNAYIKGVKNANWPPFPGRVWQRNYYERVIRDNAELHGIREYINFNPANWTKDDEYET